jgi:hypothetical protein
MSSLTASRLPDGRSVQRTSAEGVSTSRFDENVLAYDFIRGDVESESKPSIDIWFVDAKATRHDVSVTRKSGEVRVDCVLGPQVTWQPNGWTSRFCHLNTEQDVSLVFSYVPRDEWNPESIRVKIQKTDNSAILN